MVYCTQECVREPLSYRRNFMETMQVTNIQALPLAENFADGAVEVFARDGIILVVIHSGRYQITIEIG